MKNQTHILLLGLSFLLFPFFSASAQETSSDIPLSEMEIDETVFNFGEIKEGKKVEHVFTFKNVGDEPLVISSAKGSCGCTVPQWPKEAIAPGDVASFTVIFNSRNKKGLRTQKVTLVANTNPSNTFVYLKGKINPRTYEERLADIKDDVHMESNTSKDCFKIFPNPTSEILNMKMDEALVGKSVIISIFSESAQLMAQRSIENVPSNIEFNVSHFPRGTYFANVQVGGEKAQSICFVISD